MNWLKMIGAADNRLENEWLRDRYDLAERVRFPRNKRPSGVSSGDRLVLYAAGWERIYGVAIVQSDEVRFEPRTDEERWPWVLDVVTPVAVPRLDDAPTRQDLGVASTSVRQQSHIHLTDAEYERALELLLDPVKP
jgi:hypothetical protein